MQRLPWMALLLVCGSVLGADAPYAIPTPGNVTAIGENTLADLAPVFSIKPAEMKMAFFGAFGGGTFVRDYSKRVAYVITAMGGHAAPMQIAGAAIFDFQDAKWKGFENSNGVPSAGGGTAYWAQHSKGDPWQEWKDSEVPLPGHLYLIPAELPAALGGGPKGSVILLGRGAVTGDGGGGRGPHALNLDTKKWSRLTSADHQRVCGIYSSVVFDEKKGRYYSIGNIEQRKDLPYYDAADWSVLHASTPQYGWPAFGGGGHSFIDPAHRLILDITATELHAIQLDKPGEGWKVLKLTGTLPELGAEPSRFAFYPPDGNFYYRPVKNGAAVLHRLKPPAGNVLTDAWTADTVNLTQPLPDCDAAEIDGAWYTFLCYVPSIECLAWIAGAEKKVFIFKPPKDTGAAAVVEKKAGK